MNREIKFRAWDKTRNRFHFGCSNVMLDMGGLKYWQFGMSEPSPIEKQDDYIIQQFTGLKDRNGKEIYEGDIVRDEGYKDPDGDKFLDMAVVWDEKACCFTRDPGANNHFQLSVHRCWMYEVIGNIHENGDLLKVGADRD